MQVLEWGQTMYCKMLTRLWQIGAHGPSHAEHILVARVGLEIHLPGDAVGAPPAKTANHVVDFFPPHQLCSAEVAAPTHLPHAGPLL